MDRDFIQEICGIFDTNSFDLVADGGRVDLTGIFPEARYFIKIKHEMRAKSTTKCPRSR